MFLFVCLQFCGCSTDNIGVFGTFGCKTLAIMLICIGDGIRDSLNKTKDGRLEVLDGQQRITSLGRFCTGKFSYMLNDIPYKFSSLPKDIRDRIENTQLLAYICEGEESEIKEWFNNQYRRCQNKRARRIECRIFWSFCFCRSP